MAQVVMMYRTPKDAAAFDLHYFETHVPLAKLLPGLRKYEIIQGERALESPDYHLKATFHFDDAVAADVICAQLMGYEPDRIPLLSHAMNPSMDLPLRSWTSCSVKWDEKTFPDVSAIPSALARPFRPPKGWIGAIERSAEAAHNG